jgi:hypothetical protein
MVRITHSSLARDLSLPSHLVARTLEGADAWQNSILLRGDAAETVAKLKAQPGG